MFCLPFRCDSTSIICAERAAAIAFGSVERTQTQDFHFVQTLGLVFPLHAFELRLNRRVHSVLVFILLAQYSQVFTFENPILAAAEFGVIRFAVLIIFLFVKLVGNFRY